MPLRLENGFGPRARLVLFILAVAAAAYVLRGPLLRVGGLALGAAMLCFIAAPLARIYEKRLSRPAAALAALLSLAGIVGAAGWLLLPTLLRELIDLGRALPGTLARITRWLEQARLWTQARLPGIPLPGIGLENLRGLLANLAGGTVGLAANLADFASEASLMGVLAYFFLRDRDRLLLRLELLAPQAVRSVAVRMGSAVCGELRLYLWGQMTVALAVAALSTAALLLIGVRGALALGLCIGLLNMIPYFGPFIGGAPAVLIALGEGWQMAVMTLAALLIVQQLDGSWISPRIMGSLTGFSPAVVLVGVYGGARLAGVAGMLAALPVMMSLRTLYRIFVQRYENI